MQAAIAYATLRHLIEKTSPLVLFVTHYPLVAAELQSGFPLKVRTHRFAYKSGETDEKGDHQEGGDAKITFLYKVVDGIADRSYGLNVAKLAGVRRSGCFLSRSIDRSLCFGGCVVSSCVSCFTNVCVCLNRLASSSSYSSSSSSSDPGYGSEEVRRQGARNGISLFMNIHMYRERERERTIRRVTSRETGILQGPRACSFFSLLIQALIRKFR